MNELRIPFDNALARLRRGELNLLPATFTVLADTSSIPGTQPDAVLNARWHDKQYRFAVEYTSINTPRVFNGAVNQILQYIRFPNLEVHEADDQSVYFDIRRQGDIPCASPIQTLLELSHAGEREREIARDISRLILKYIK